MRCFLLSVIDTIVKIKRQEHCKRVPAVFLFPLAKEKHVLFPVGQEKNEKKPRTYRSIVCASRELLLSAPIQKIQAIYTHSGFCAILCFRFYVFLKKYRVTTRVCTRKLVQSTAEHAERAVSAIRVPLRLRAQTFRRQSLPARRMTESARKCAVPSVGSPCVCVSQQKDGSLRR